jgi:outer membrane protein
VTKPRPGLSGSCESSFLPITVIAALKELTLTALIYISISVLMYALNPGSTAISEEGVVEFVSKEVLTVQGAVSTALAQNRNIENAALDVSKAGDDIYAAKTKLFPEFDFSIFELYHLTDEAFTFKEGAFGDFPIIGPIPAENTTINTTPNFTTYLTASIGQPLSQLYEISLFVKQREVEQKLFDQELRASRQEIADRVKKEYYNILKSQSSIRSKDEKIVFLTSLSKLVERNVAVERALEEDSLEVKARLAQVEYERFVLRNQLATQKERMNKLLGRDIETPFTVLEVPDAEPYVIDTEDAEDIALSQRPEIKSAKLYIEFAENEVRLKKAKYIPEIGVEFNYIANFNIELLPENIATVGLFAKYDVFQWGKKHKEVSKKKKAVLQAENELDEAEAQVRIDVNSKIRKLEESAVLIGVTELEQIAAREKLRVTLNKYKVQKALLTDLLEAESSLEDKNDNYEKAVLDYWTARADLEKALGEL